MVIGRHPFEPTAERNGPGKLDTVVSEIFLGLSGRQIRRDRVEVHRIQGASVQCAMSASGIVNSEVVDESGSDGRGAYE